MEGSNAYNPGFLGSHFNWWIGQIADDSTWRDNNPSGKHESSAQIEGWGKRYKVRIIGIHDMGEANIPSDQLPFAQVMYPVTAGGGQAGSIQTANLSQGNMVFGFFLDGQDQQVPVIMGVLGNNSATPLSMSIGDNRVTDDVPGFIGRSGYAIGAAPRENELRAPDDDLVIQKPGVSNYLKLNRYGNENLKDEYGLYRDYNYPNEVYQKKQELSIKADERYDVSQRGQKIQFIRNELEKYLTDQLNIQTGPNSPNTGIPTKESTDSFHQQSVADIKKSEFYDKKIPLMKAAEPVVSAMNSIQIVIENFVAKVNKYLHTFQSYLEAASTNITGIDQLKTLMKKTARLICKYMKVILDKIMEYVLKVFNEAFAKIISAIPGSYRHLFGDIKEQMTEKINCLYAAIINKKICPLIEDLLSKGIDLETLEKEAKQKALNDKKYKTSPDVFVCYPEDIVAETIFGLSDDINKKNQDLLKNMSKLIDEIKSFVPDLNGIPSLDVSGNINTALSFKNINLNVFGCDLMPDVPASDFYTLSGGSGGQAQSLIPNVTSIFKRASNAPKGKLNPVEPVPFATPSKNQKNVKYSVEGRPEPIVIKDISQLNQN